MALVAGVDFGGGSVKACLATVEDGDLVALVEEPTPRLHPAPGRVEFDPDAWWAAAGSAMRRALATAERDAVDVVAVSVTSLRQGYVLLGADGELGPGVVNADRRGADHLERLRRDIGSERLYALTGHWPAPQLTLPKLLQEQAERGRWEAAESVLFVHDWAIWRLTGRRLSERTLASAGQMLDVTARSWASDLLDEVGLGTGRLPSFADAGTVAGPLTDGSLGLPTGIDVVVGGADTQVAAAGAGGLEPGIVSIVAGTTTPLQVSTPGPRLDPDRHPWVSTHLVPDRWVSETNAGYAGMNLDWLARLSGRSPAELVAEAAGSPVGAAGISAIVAARTWSERTWSIPAPALLVGFEPSHERGDVARAFVEAHAYGIRGNLEDLERATGERATRLVLLGGAGRSQEFAQLVADVVGRPIARSRSPYPAARAFAWLARRAAGVREAPPALDSEHMEPHADAAYEEAYGRYIRADEVSRSELAGWAS